MLSSTVVELVLHPPWYRQNASFDSIKWSLSVLHAAQTSVLLRCEDRRQSILDAWTFLDFCERAKASRVCLLCHGSACCVHGKRR